MTDTDKLKRLKKEIKRKEFWRETRDCRDYVTEEICDADDYGSEERYIYSDWLRDTILALIADNEALNDYGKSAAQEAVQYRKERDESVALLRELFVYQNNGIYDAKISAFLARIDGDA